MLGFPVFSSAVNGIEMRKTKKRVVTDGDLLSVGCFQAGQLGERRSAPVCAVPKPATWLPRSFGVGGAKTGLLQPDSQGAALGCGRSPRWGLKESRFEARGWRMHWFAFMRPRGRGVARQAGLKAIQDLGCKIQEMGNAKSQGPEFCRVADINNNVGATPRCAMAIVAMPRRGQDARRTSGPNIPSIRSPDVLILPWKTADKRCGEVCHGGVGGRS
jgi:hypothetical protein